MQQRRNHPPVPHLHLQPVRRMSTELPLHCRRQAGSLESHDCKRGACCACYVLGLPPLPFVRCRTIRPASPQGAPRKPPGKAPWQPATPFAVGLRGLPPALPYKPPAGAPIGGFWGASGANGVKTPSLPRLPNPLAFVAWGILWGRAPKLRG